MRGRNTVYDKMQIFSAHLRHLQRAAAVTEIEFVYIQYVLNAKCILFFRQISTYARTHMKLHAELPCPK